jgi:hypothetical protein
VSSGTFALLGRGADESRWVEPLARAGLAAKGVLYGVIALLAFKVARGGREEAPDKDGALQAIAGQPFGRGLLALLALGLAGYALWRLAQAVFDRENAGDGLKGLAKRGGQLARAAWWGVLCGFTVSTLVEGKSKGGGGSSSSEQKATAGVFEWPLGRELVYGVGLAFLAAAGFNLWRGVTCRFNKKLKTGQMGDAEEAAATGVGFAGHVARGIVFALIALFLLRAAWEFDPKEARGLDGALLEVAQAPWGGLLLAGVAAGLLCYALYCFVQARYRRV